jgi:hypothetical protein
MKKLKEIGNALTRNEMKSVMGGFRQCGINDGFVCGPLCPAPDDNIGLQTTGWKCDSPQGACRPYACGFPT